MADKEEKLKPKGFQQKVKRPVFWQKIRLAEHSSTLAKDRLKMMTQHSSEVSDQPTGPLPVPRPQFGSDSMRRFFSFFIALIIAGGTFVKDLVKKMMLYLSEAENTPGAPSRRLRFYFLPGWMRQVVRFLIPHIIAGVTFAKDRLTKMLQRPSEASATPGAPSPRSRAYFLLNWMRRAIIFFIELIIAGVTFAKDRLTKMMQHPSEASATPGESSSGPQLHFPSDNMRRAVSFSVVLIIGGGLAIYLHLLAPLSVPSAPKGGEAIIRVSKTASQYQTVTSTPAPQDVPTPTPVPQPTPTPLPQPTPTPTPVPQPTPTPAPALTPLVISSAIPTGNLLYSTASPFSACDKQGGHWTATSGAQVTCTPKGSEMINTSGQLAVVNLDQLGGNQAPWPGQSFIVQVQVTINPNSAGAFGMDFQPDTGDNTQGYFAYLLNPPNGWAFNYCTQSTPISTLVSSQLLSPVSTKFTLDIRVEGTTYTFYIDGVDTTGIAVTGSQFLNKIVGLTVGAGADVTFSNLAIYALP